MKKILIVDDDETIRHSFSEFLKNPDYNIETAGNGNEAVEKVNKAPYDLILMDLVMPEMDGFEATRRIREMKRWPYIPIVITSGLEDPKDIEKALELGADEYVVKPVGIASLQARVRAMLRLKEAHDRLSESEERFRGVFEQDQRAIILLDPATSRIIDANPAVENLFGHPKRQIMEHGHALFSGPDGLLASYCDGSVHLSLPLRKKYTGKDGHEIILEIKCFSIMLRESDVLYFSFHDVTEKVRLEELWTAHEELKAMDRMKDEFIELVSHELRTPLTSILGYAEAIAECEFPPEKQNRCAQTIIEESERLSRLIENVLDLSNLRTGKPDFHFKETILDAIVNRTIRSLEGLAAEKGIAIHYNPSEIKFSGIRIGSAK